MIDYVRNLLGNATSQMEFYTDPTVINAFKNYTSEIVTRYKDSPAIFAWELANEVRLPLQSSFLTKMTVGSVPRSRL